MARRIPTTSQYLWACALATAAAAAPACTPYPSLTRQLQGTNPYFHNASDSAVTVQIFRAGPAGLHCTVVAEDPGAYLTPDAFGTARTETIEPDQNVEISVDGYGGECHTVLLTTAEGPKVIFWMADELGQRTEPESSPEITDAAIVLTQTGDGVTARSPIGLVHDIKEFTPAAGERFCADLPEEVLVPSEVHPDGWWQLTDLGTSPEGCRRLHLARGPIDALEQETSQWDVCLDDRDFPFDVGDALEFRGETESLLITSVLGDSPAFAAPKAVLYSGRVGGPLVPLPELTATSVDDGCVPQRTDGCVDVQVPMALEISSEPDTVFATLTPERPETVYLDAGDTEWRIRMERNTSHPVLDRSCWPIGANPDVRVFIISQPETTGGE